MHSRREFLQRAALLTGASFAWGAVPESIAAALRIDPEPGSTFLDAEHIVVLMQENRSFDHTFGSLQGVRGYSDPRAFKLANGNPVWLQSNAKGETFVPFRLDMMESNATWMGSLPHSWTNQVDARNNGRYDKWLHVKSSGNKSYSVMPLTLGYYDRRDIPYYYALADAFTVCDQNFCSSLTGTTPNRLFLWTGTNRPTMDGTSFAAVRNEEVDYGREANWKTFPERLEENGISWKIYQNELSLDSGFQGEEDAWLSNFTDNPIEWFSQYNVRLASGHQKHLERRENNLAKQIPQLESDLKAQAAGSEAHAAATKKLEAAKKELAELKVYRREWNPERKAALTERERSLHDRAFTVNSGHPDYRTLATLTYDDKGTTRNVKVPKGDILHQFRQDVATGKLPTVSWLVPPECFSDHPGSAWYGAWYLAEVLDILTKNPEVWKKTIFVLTYDENDGYFDHVQPFVAPNPKDPTTGKTTAGIDTAVDYVELEQERKRNSAGASRQSPVGLGYRVPMVVASPWSRGGAVCSEVFDHTSVLQLMEQVLSHKTGKRIRETNISPWRRAICGDLSSAFRPFKGDKIDGLSFPTQEQFVESIHRAQFKGTPTGFKPLSSEEITRIRAGAPYTARIQESGNRDSCPLPYELYADISIADGKLSARFEAGNKVFGSKSSGSPFNAYAYLGGENLAFRSYAVEPGHELGDTWNLSDFSGGKYHLRIDGPNGFMREIRGSTSAPALGVVGKYVKDGRSLTGDLELILTNRDSTPRTVEVNDVSYSTGSQRKVLKPAETASIIVPSINVNGWYDVVVTIEGVPDYSLRYAGRVETGKWSVTDPAMA